MMTQLVAIVLGGAVILLCRAMGSAIISGLLAASIGSVLALLFGESPIGWARVSFIVIGVPSFGINLYWRWDRVKQHVKDHLEFEKKRADLMEVGMWDHRFDLKR